MKRLPAALAVAASVALAACTGDPIAPTDELGRPSLSHTGANGVVVVTEEDITRQPENTPPTDDWVLYTRLAGNGAFRSGPGTPPLGVGSLELVTPTGADKVTLFNYDHIGTQLDDISAISYSTYRIAGSGEQVAALNIQVDVNGAAPGGFTTLVYEPVYNGDVQDGVWQSWDAFLGGNAIWWSSNPIPGAPNRDTFVSWNTILANNPDAVIVGGFGVNQGSGNPALTSAVDALRLAYGSHDLTYDFEPFRVATDRDACKNGGWMTLKRADGSSFKNQGDCVSYVNTGH
jgi:hypothetical protein